MPQPAPVQVFAFRLAQFKVLGGPVLGAAVSDNCPEYLHHPVGLEMHYLSRCGNLHLLDGDIAALMRVHQVVTLWPAQPVPSVAVHSLEIAQGAVPGVEQDVAEVEAGSLACSQHRSGCHAVGIFLCCGIDTPPELQYPFRGKPVPVE
jgi:hypothetical protein